MSHASSSPFSPNRASTPAGDASPPYLSVRLGANLSDHGGIYFSPMVGYRFNWGRKTALNFGLGITLFGRRMPTYSHIPSPDYPDSYIPVESGHYQGHFVKFTASLSLDFQLP